MQADHDAAEEDRRLKEEAQIVGPRDVAGDVAQTFDVAGHVAQTFDNIPAGIHIAAVSPSMDVQDANALEDELISLRFQLSLSERIIRSLRAMEDFNHANR